MRSTRLQQTMIALFGSISLTTVFAGCDSSANALSPAPVVAVSSYPSYQPYYPSKNYQFVLYATTITATEAMTGIVAYDNTGAEVTSWTWVTTGSNAPSVNATAFTFTVLLTPPAASQTSLPPRIPSGRTRPASVATGGPPGSGTLVITTTTTTTTVPVIKVNQDPCGLM